MKATGRPRGSKDGAGARQPKAFRIVEYRGQLGVYIGSRVYPVRALEVSLLASAIITRRRDGALQIEGRGIVTPHGDVVAITA